MREIALGHGSDRARHLGGRPKQIFDQRVDRDFHVVPGATTSLKADSFAGLAFFANRQTDPLQLLRHLLIGRHNLIEIVSDLAGKPRPGNRQADAEIAVLHRLKTLKDFRHVLGWRMFLTIGREAIGTFLSHHRLRSDGSHQYDL